MSEITKIEWATHTFNPWIGCTKVSPGCAHCYAEARDRRLTKGGKAAHWGLGAPRQRTSLATWRNPVKWNRQAAGGHRPRIFPSLCDWLDDAVPIEWLADFLKIIHDTPNLDWLLLTKRPENFLDRIGNALAYWKNTTTSGKRTVETMLLEWLNNKPPANVWLGVSVENQECADERIPPLLQAPAAVRFLSVEPLLDHVNLRDCCADEAMGVTYDALTGSNWTDSPLPKIDWVIVGGESGPGARPCNVEWIRSIVHQCKAAQVPCFVKQVGSRPLTTGFEAGKGIVEVGLLIKHPKGGDPAEWPEDLRVRQFPS